MLLSASILAVAKLAAIFAVLVIMLRLHVPLWLGILAGALATLLFSGISPWQWPSIAATALTHTDFIFLCIMVFLIMLLSAVQAATGQSRKLVEGLKRYLDRPRLRLVIFPALVGLLPMPGGALFSCPMIEAAAKDMNITDQKKSLINYWFRHIWETAWPLYPGYALTCTLMGISMTQLWKYTFPLVILAFAVGWYYYMRDLARSPLLKSESCRGAETPDARPGHNNLTAALGKGANASARDESLGQVLMHALPIGVTLVGAAVFAYFLNMLYPDIPGQAAFSLSLFCAVLTALWQGGMSPGRELFRLAFSSNTSRIMLILVSIYTFKECIISGGIVGDLGRFGDSNLVILLTVIILPFVSGLLTGIMVGFVGLSFPIILALVEHSPLKEYTLPLVVLALIAGNCGQMISPLHVCLVVTCEFFNTGLPSIWRYLVRPALAIFLGGALWVALLAIMGLHF